MIMDQRAKDKLIVALDVDSAELALDLFTKLRDVVGMFKIGSQLFTAAGPDIVRKIVSLGGRVFLDLKFHDIPNTVAATGIEATRLGVSIFNVHASGGAEMMRRTLDAVKETAERETIPKPKIIAVTVLTSLDQAAVRQIGFADEPRALVKRLALAAAECGLDGVVASPQEIQVVRNAIADTGFLIVTPGIRANDIASDDQRRTLNAAQAIKAGANYLVVGRPILKAARPADAAQRIVEEIEGALVKLESTS